MSKRTVRYCVVCDCARIFTGTPPEATCSWCSFVDSENECRLLNADKKLSPTKTSETSQHKGG